VRQSFAPHPLSPKIIRASSNNLRIEKNYPFCILTQEWQGRNRNLPAGIVSRNDSLTKKESRSSDISDAVCSVRDHIFLLHMKMYTNTLRFDTSAASGHKNAAQSWAAIN
jgi:hypothetical protein